MTDAPPDDLERRALELLERLIDRPRSRARILKGQPEAVRARIAALEAAAAGATAAVPTGDLGASLAEPPPRVGPFRLLERVGTGGMGSVWRAVRDDGLYEQVVAVKFVHVGLGPAAARRFEAERRLLARLEAPGIARLIDGGVTSDGLAYLVMEFVEGRPIDAACRGLAIGQRVALFAEAARAVQFAHARLVVHGDLKPANILVDSTGRARLVDFGVGRLLEGETAGDERHPLTADFASPERRAGAPPSIADDVFALSVVLRLLTEDAADADLSAIAAKGTDADERSRYASVADLMADLDRWKERLPVRARAPTSAYRAERFLARHGRLVAATVAVIAALASAAGLATFNYVRAENARQEADRRFLEVRAISRFMLFDLYDRLAEAPGAVEARVRLAATAERYLDRLAASPDPPLDLRLELAQGYRRLARVQGVSGVASLGRPSDALDSLASAERLALAVAAQDPRNAEALELLGDIQADRWTLAPDNAESAAINAAARERYGQALAADPTRPGARLGLIGAEKNRAYDLIWAEDRPKDAIPVLEAALAELRRSGLKGEDARLMEVHLLNRLGDAIYYAGDIQGSLGPYREAEALVDARLAEGPALEWLARKGESDWNVSGSLGDLGRLDEALAKAREGRAVMTGVLSYGPDANAEKRLLILLGQEAALLAEQGDARAAVEPSLRSVALREARAAREPDDPQRARDLALGLEQSAHVLARAGDRPEACRLAGRSAAAWAAIQARGRLSRKDAQKNLPAAAAAQRDYC